MNDFYNVINDPEIKSNLLEPNKECKYYFENQPNDNIQNEDYEENQNENNMPEQGDENISPNTFNDTSKAVYNTKPPNNYMKISNNDQEETNQIFLNYDKEILEQIKTDRENMYSKDGKNIV